MREEPSVCLGAVGSAETGDMLCGLSRDSPAEAGTWSMQAPQPAAERGPHGRNGAATLEVWMGKRTWDL